MKNLARLSAIACALFIVLAGFLGCVNPTMDKTITPDPPAAPELASLVLKNGTSTLSLTGTNTYTGSTVVDGGLLIVSGRITGNTAVAVGSNNAGVSMTVSGGGTGRADAWAARSAFCRRYSMMSTRKAL